MLAARLLTEEELQGRWDVVRALLADFKRHNVQVIMPEVVYAQAVDPEHPLHDWLDWDDRAVADRARVREITELLSSVRVPMDKLVPPKVEICGTYLPKKGPLS